MQRISLHKQSYSPDTSTSTRRTHASRGDIPLTISCSARPMGVKLARPRTATGAYAIVYARPRCPMAHAGLGFSISPIREVSGCSHSTMGHILHKLGTAREMLLASDAPYLHPGIRSVTPTWAPDLRGERSYPRWKASNHGDYRESSV
jgi:hypothetical protein